MRKIVFFIAGILCFFAFNYPAQAVLIGDLVDIGHYYPNLSSSEKLINDIPVTNGVEWSYSYSIYYVDVQTSSIVITYNPIYGGSHFTPSSFNGPVISDLDDSSGLPLTGVDVTTNIPGWSSSRLSYGSDYTRFNIQNLTLRPGMTLKADLMFGSGATAVPEPSTLILAGTGLLGLIVRRRRR